jgi:hypothetical protein
MFTAFFVLTSLIRRTKPTNKHPLPPRNRITWFSVILFYGGVYVPTDKRTNCARHSGFTDPAGSVMDILNNIDQDDVDVRELAEKVSRDLALTAKTLRFANSAYYTTMVKVTTIDQAISLLGLHQVRQIIISAALTGCFPKTIVPASVICNSGDIQSGGDCCTLAGKAPEIQSRRRRHQAYCTTSARWCWSAVTVMPTPKSCGIRKKNNYSNYLQSVTYSAPIMRQSAKRWRVRGCSPKK